VKNFYSTFKPKYEEQNKKIEETTKAEGLDPTFFPFGSKGNIDRNDILASIPSKGIVDKLVQRYLNAFDPAVHILHVPTFMKHYEAHWADSNRTPDIWLGMLFAIMSLALQSYGQTWKEGGNGDEPEEFKGKVQPMSALFQKRTEQCLVLADFTKPESHMIETLILHLQSHYNRSREADITTWVMIGMIVRLAMRMGYHRDPSHYPKEIPVFDAEMRRRVWTFIHCMDLLFSFQIGLPNMIRSSDTDTRLPSNLRDDEIFEGMEILPPSRPTDDYTEVSYMRTKAKLAFVFGRIIEQLNSLSTCTYDEVMKLDAAIRAEHAAIPELLKFRTVDDSPTDPAPLIMARFNLDLLFQKAMCVLHRRFLVQGRTNPRYRQSRKACIDASMDLLKRQQSLHKEKTARLKSAKWFISSLAVHDFLIAAMIVCLDLNYGTNNPTRWNHFYDWGVDRRDEMLSALDGAQRIYREMQDYSIEAFKASSMLEMMITKLRSAGFPSPQRGSETSSGANFTPSGSSESDLNSPVVYPNGAGHGTTQNSSFSTTGYSPLNMSEDPTIKPEHNAAMTLGMLSSGGLTPNTAAFFDVARTGPQTPGGNIAMAGSNNDGQIPATDGDPFGMGSTFLPPTIMTDMPANLDWVCTSTLSDTYVYFGRKKLFANVCTQDAWESFVQGTSLDPSQTNFFNNGLGANIDYNMNFPNSPENGNGQSQNQNQNQPQSQNRGGNDGSGVFMGASSPNWGKK
jgi:Fungal specific transcription factor domain